MPATSAYNYWQIVKYDSFGNNPVLLLDKYIDSIENLEVDYAGRSLTGSFTADALKIGVNPFDIIIVNVIDTTNTLPPKPLYRGQAITLGNKKDVGLTNFGLIGLEDSLKHIKPTLSEYGESNIDVATLVSLILTSFLTIQNSNFTFTYSGICLFNPDKIVTTGLIVDKITLITESYWDLFEYCKNLTGDLNYEWGIGLDREFFFKPVNGVDTLQVDEEISITWKEVNCASHVNTIDFYFPTEDSALEYRAIDATVLDINGNLTRPERRKTYLLDFEELVTELTLGTQYIAGNAVPQIQPNPSLATLDVLFNSNPNQLISLQDSNTSSASSVGYPRLGEYLTDNKDSTFLAITMPANTNIDDRVWYWDLTLPKSVIGYKAKITFDSNATGPISYPPSTLPFQLDKLPYFSVLFERGGNVSVRTAYVEYSHGTASAAIIKKEKLPEFELGIYRANNKISTSNNDVKIIIAGDATFVTLKINKLTMYTVDTNLLDSIAKALFKQIPEDPGTLFVNKLVVGVLPKISFSYRDENFTVQSLERKALIYRYKITDDDFLVTEIELEQAYTANDEQRAQIIIDRDTETRVKSSVVKRAVA